MTVTTVQLLEEAKALLMNAGWTQGAFGRDAEGEKLGRSQLTTEAVCFCALGAIRASLYANTTIDERCESHSWNLLIKIDDTLAEAIDGTTTVDIADWNDDPKRTKAEVFAAFDRAIVIAKGRS